MDKIELRKELLTGMCNCAENIYFTWHNLSFHGSECPEAFKPDIADKFMFNQIIDLVIDNIHEELKERRKVTSDMMGVNIMAKYYYPYYGIWKDMRLT